jgi:uncharacterized protein
VVCRRLADDFLSNLPQVPDLLSERRRYMLFRPAVTLVRQAQSRRRDAIVGFAGGFVGGLTAMPGALPTIWCDLRGLPKNQQRGLVQPFIAAMQMVALLLMMSRSTLPTGMLNDFMIALPALLAGTAAGIVMFGRVNERPSGAWSLSSC